MSIKEWKEDDRPREKFYLKGKQAMSDSELLAILIGMGHKEKSALDIAKEILSENNQSLYTLSQRSVKDLMKYKGLGMAKAITIAAALEIGNRKQSEAIPTVDKVNSSRLCFELLREKYSGLKQEEFYVLLLNKSLKPLRIEKLSMGKIDAAFVDVKIIVKLALDYHATAVVISHNHPSGNLTPSPADKELTESVNKALALFDIKLTDHLIVFETKYFSFADEGLMKI